MKSNGRTGRVLSLILLGPPGAGKGTQARQLCSTLGIPHISTGDMLRSHTRAETKLGAEARSFMSAGELVPDRLVLAMVKERLSQPDTRGGCLLDGFPRSVPQAEALTGILEECGMPLTAALQLDLDDEAIVTRLKHRRSCPKCGRIYHLVSSPPRRPDLCDTDGFELVWRPDDRESVIRNRLQVYHQQTEPLIGLYQRLGKLGVINAGQAPGRVQADILTTLHQRTGSRFVAN